MGVGVWMGGYGCVDGEGVDGGVCASMRQKVSERVT